MKEPRGLSLSHLNPASSTNPAQLTAQLTNLPSWRFRWENSELATSYAYCISSTASCTTWISTGTATSVTLTSLTPGTRYWQVRAINADGTTYGDGSSNDWWSFTVPTKPGAFNKLTPGNGLAGLLTNATITWGASRSVSYYQYCVNTSATNCAAWSNTVSTSANLTNLNPRSQILLAGAWEE